MKKVLEVLLYYISSQRFWRINFFGKNVKETFWDIFCAFWINNFLDTFLIYEKFSDQNTFHFQNHDMFARKASSFFLLKEHKDCESLNK